MAFWGVEVRPGKPFTHKPGNAKGRLHVSQGTLGIGTATNKSVVQCNVGNKTPIFLCALFPDKTESCQLNLEFEETDEVIFSVIGPRSVHLTGYYLRGGLHVYPNDDSESFGEDIADTETERSPVNSDEDNYEDSFIDDNDLEGLPHSPGSRNGDEELLDRKKPDIGVNRHRRLRKKYQLTESDDNDDSQQQKFADRQTEGTLLDSEDDDMYPISSIYKGKHGVNSKSEVTKEVDKGTSETTRKSKDEGKYVLISETKVDAIVGGELERNGAGPNKNGKEQSEEEGSLGEEGADDFFFGMVKPKKDEMDANKTGHTLPVQNTVSDEGASRLYCSRSSTDVGHENTMQKKKTKEQKRGETTEVDKTLNGDVIKEKNALQDKDKADNLWLDLPVQTEQNQQRADLSDGYAPPLPSAEVSPLNGEGTKRKRKKREQTTVGDVSSYYTSVIKEDKTELHDVQSEFMAQNFHMREKQNDMQADDKNLDNYNDQHAVENQSGEKKKKKKRKTCDDVGALKMETASLSMGKLNRSDMDSEDNNAKDKALQLRSLANGLVIEELETGNGKIAVPGKKISVRYVGKLKGNGEIFDSNFDGPLFKFRLGERDIIEGWNVGLDGMCVGGKRRLIVPPSLGYGSEGDGKCVPPDSWLVYDVELLKVR